MKTALKESARRTRFRRRASGLRGIAAARTALEAGLTNVPDEVLVAICCGRAPAPKGSTSPAKCSPHQGSLAPSPPPTTRTAGLATKGWARQDLELQAASNWAAAPPASARALP
jgi:hypothetical protein